MEGVVNTIKEFSDDYHDLYNSWKYVVTCDESGINIQYLEKDGDEWKEEDSFDIVFSCAEKLFREVVKSLDNGDFKLL